MTKTSKNASKVPWHKDILGVHMFQMQNDNLEMRRAEDNELTCYNNAIQMSKDGVAPMIQGINGQIY